MSPPWLQKELQMNKSLDELLEEYWRLPFRVLFSYGVVAFAICAVVVFIVKALHTLLA